jgi:predicted DNA-binding protein YlxM (UPF0122 family)
MSDILTVFLKRNLVKLRGYTEKLHIIKKYKNLKNLYEVAEIENIV